MKTGRNDPCPCGSGRKYKQCHMLLEQQAAQAENIPALMQQANQLHANGRAQQAQELAERVLRLDPNYESALHLLGLLSMQAGKGEAAAAWFAKATVAHPSNPDHFSNLGAVLVTLSKLEPAVEYLGKALAMAPSADSHNNMGAALQKLGRSAEAAIHFRQAVQMKPGSATMWTNLGNALSAIGEDEESRASFGKALALAPNDPDALLNFGNLQVKLGQVEEGIGTFSRLLALIPEHGPGNNNMGNLLQGKGLHKEASQHFKRALANTSGRLRVEISSSLLYNLAQQEAVGAVELFQEHLKFGETYEAPLRAVWPQHANSRDPERVLRVGIVSGDLRFHAVASFIEPLLVQLAKSTQLEMYAYSTCIEEDNVSERLKGYFAHWLLVPGLLDEDLSQRVQQDQIDILIDLSGHTGHNRLLAFARKPAPVQASWIGYPGTTGLQAMDYYLSDRHFLPPGQFDDQFTEKIVHLPAEVSFVSVESPPDVGPLPGLTNGYPTFGSFNRASKISREVVTLWAQLLRQVPQARMVLGAMPQDGDGSFVEAWFIEEGVDKSRLTFYGRRTLPEYLALHNQVDFCLDTFPYNGGTTTFCATVMGVPTLTLAGETPASRSGAGILGQVGLETFVAHDHEDFVRKGAAWAVNLTELAAIRAGLRERFDRSPLGQPAVVAAGLESALRTMWRRWCAGQPPESFAVDEQSLPSR